MSGSSMPARVFTRLRAIVVNASGAPRRSVLLVVAMALFVFSWLFRYNDPAGELGGLLDDHFFYAVQSWQILFGDLPDRDYVDPGAPLTFAISAGLQILLGRSIWSEFVFCVTVLSVGAAITYVVAARVTGSTLLGLAAAGLEIALLPRLYNYPKIIIYALAIPALWAWAQAPRMWRTWLLAATTALGFLLRHDHGIYIGAAFGVLLLGVSELSWRQRIQHGLVFAFATLLLLAPYLTYLQVNGGIARHFVTANSWASRDYGRAPLVLPTLEWQPLADEAGSDAPAEEWWNHAPFPAIEGYYTWWIYWFITLLPPLALLLLVVRPGTGPPGFPRERLNILVVALLGMVVNARFLRGNLDARFADVAVPTAILAVWSLGAAATIVRAGRIKLGSRTIGVPAAGRVLVGTAATLVVLVTALLLLRPMREQIENSSLFDGPGLIYDDVLRSTAQLTTTWPLDSSFAESRSGPVQLAVYFEACTAPTDRILLVPLVPQALGLAQRGFAGGHIDLRPGFFGTVDDQNLTIARLRSQSVPVVIGPHSRDMRDYVENLPLIADYFDQEYVNLGDQELEDGLSFSLLVNRNARSVRTYEPLSFPCFR